MSTVQGCAISAAVCAQREGLYTLGLAQLRNCFWAAFIGALQRYLCEGLVHKNASTTF